MRGLSSHFWMNKKYTEACCGDFIKFVQNEGYKFEKGDQTRCGFSKKRLFLFNMYNGCADSCVKFYKTDTKKVLQFFGKSVIIYRLDMR